MNKTEFTARLAERLDVPAKEAAATADAIFEEIRQSVARGDTVRISGLGTFEKVPRPARSARNPATGETIKIKATKTPRFRANSSFKKVVAETRNGAKRTFDTEPTAKKTTAKKTTAKKATAKKATTKKATAKKTTAKKATAKKATAKKATAKKATAKRGRPAKKATTAKATTKKATTAKATTKKTTAKRGRPAKKK